MCGEGWGGGVVGRGCTGAFVCQHVVIQCMHNIILRTKRLGDYFVLSYILSVPDPARVRYTETMHDIIIE